MKLPESVKPIWRTVQIFQIARGVDTGLRQFIVGPFLYTIFSTVSGEESAMFYTALVWAIYCGLSAVLELPTGALADIFGRVRTLIIAMFLNLLYGVGLACLVCFQSFSLILSIALFVFVLRAFAYTIYNGSFTAWVVDSINEVHPGFGYERMLARGNVYYYWCKIVGGIMGVAMFLHGVGYIAFVTGSMVCLCCAAYCMAVMEETASLKFLDWNEFKKIAFRSIKDTITTGVRACHATPILWWLLAFYAIYDFLIGVVQYLWPVFMSANWGAQKWSPEWYGMVFAVPMVSAFGAHFISWWGDFVQHKTGKKASNWALRTLMYGTTVFFVVLPILGLGLLNFFGMASFAVFALSILCVESTAGTITPCFESLMNNYIPAKNTKERATILSIGSMLSGLLLLLLLIPSSGASGATTVVGWILPACLLLVVIILGYFRFRSLENVHRKQPVLTMESGAL